ncbi:unnamed protein product [Medioppia subpectinata]|uniref:Uncharacterized protein n=1 Tax=Medioppia subpectinata TaxID=1979941 RepID=A0A7R9PVB6_9ACAR|nr:unnamed protein product [Medioppia subpectinata]CAG2102097.1 unnamed protein product [Medioppia subpectinata]
MCRAGPPTQPSPQTCGRRESGSVGDRLSASHVFQMSETTNCYPIMSKHKYRCNECGLTCAHMYIEPMAPTYWDHVVPHHHSLHHNFYYRKKSVRIVADFLYERCLKEVNINN